MYAPHGSCFLSLRYYNVYKLVCLLNFKIDGGEKERVKVVGSDVSVIKSIHYSAELGTLLFLKLLTSLIFLPSTFCEISHVPWFTGFILPHKWQAKISWCGSQ